VKNRPQQTPEAGVFQWAVILAGGLLWLGSLVRLLVWSDGSAFVAVALLGLAAVAVSFKPVRITSPGMKLGNKRHISLTVSDAVTFLLLVLYGPAAAIVVGGVDGFVASRRSVRRIESNVFTLGMLALSFFCSGLVYELAMRFEGVAPYAGFSHRTAKLILPLFIATTVHFLVVSSSLATILGLRYRTPIRRQWVDNQLWTAVTYFPLPLVSIAIYFCVQHYGWVTTLAAAPALLLIYFSYQQYNQKVEEKMRRIEEMNELHLATVQALALAIDAKDSTTAAHVERVRIYGRRMARLFGLPELETQAVEAGAMLHDIGKLAVPDYILTKPGRLTPAEQEKMKTHTVVGAEILERVSFPYPIVPIVRHHHERWDGRGYPDGLSGEEIPLTARILSVVDSFDSSREPRQHRRALTREKAVELLLVNAGTAYDPKVVEVFINHLPEFEAEIKERNLGYATVALSAQMGATGAPAAGGVTGPEQSYSQSLARISEAHREAVLMYEIAQSVGSSLSLPDTLAELLARVSDIVPSSTSAVLLKEKETGQLRVAHALGQSAPAFHGCSIPVGQGLSGWVFANQRPMFNADPGLELGALGLAFDIRYLTSVVVPLASGEEVVGVLALYSAELEEYSNDHLRLVENIARLASDAVANAVRHEETEATACTDRLTGLPNLRAILRAFDAETERARRSGQPFTFLLMDLDNFKQVNDTLGHHVGDLFLIEISSQIKTHLRATDFFGRYAGDEFIAILPNTRVPEISPLVERIRDSVDNCVVQVENGQQARGGVSIGLAECDGHETSLEEMIARADQAMYADKAERRRRRAAGSAG